MQDSNKNASQTNFLIVATDYLLRGWQPLPVPFRSKNPNFPGWQHFVTTEADLPKHFNGKPQNIGVLLGSKSNGLIDVDLDSSEAIKIADYFLPKTEAVFGRESKPRSHRLYISDFPKIEKFEFNETIAEIRSTGGQTVFPFSTHESGESIEWLTDGEPRKIEAKDLRRCVALLSSACALSKYWIKGSRLRHKLSLAVSGAFLRNGFTENETINFIRAVCVASNDEELEDRLKVVESTAEKLRNKENVFGFPRLAELTDEKLVKTLYKWLEIEKPSENTDTYQNASTAQSDVKCTFNFATLDELLSEPEEEHAYLWENTLILGGFSICSAKPKVGKSTLARNLAVAITQGADFLGRETKEGKVIYLCLEEKRSEVAKHFRMMKASGKGILIHTGKTPENALRELEFAIAEFEPILVIIDPLARVLRVGDFNDYGTMSRGLEPFIDLARKTNVHILALHHDSKGDREGGDALLGSTALFGAVDCHLQMRKKNNGRTVMSEQRYGVNLPETVIELDGESGVISDRGDLQSYILEQKKSEILDSINDTEKITETEIKERVGGNSKGIISKAVRLLLDEKKLNREGDGKRNNPFLYFKTPETKSDYAETEKPRNDADKHEAKSDFSDSGFLGFSNSENPENLENPETNNSPNFERRELFDKAESNLKTDFIPKADFSDCPNCPAQIPIVEDDCPACGKRALDF